MKSMVPASSRALASPTKTTIGKPGIGVAVGTGVGRRRYWCGRRREQVCALLPGLEGAGDAVPPVVVEPVGNAASLGCGHCRGPRVFAQGFQDPVEPVDAGDCLGGVERVLPGLDIVTVTSSSGSMVIFRLRSSLRIVPETVTEPFCPWQSLAGTRQALTALLKARWTSYRVLPPSRPSPPRPRSAWYLRAGRPGCRWGICSPCCRRCFYWP